MVRLSIEQAYQPQQCVFQSPARVHPRAALSLFATPMLLRGARIAEAPPRELAPNAARDPRAGCASTRRI